MNDKQSRMICLKLVLKVDRLDMSGYKLFHAAGLVRQLTVGVYSNMRNEINMRCRVKSSNKSLDCVSNCRPLTERALVL